MFFYNIFKIHYLHKYTNIDNTPRQQDHFYEEFLEPKRVMQSELLGLKALVSNSSTSEPKKSSLEKYLDFERLLIGSLDDRIISFERQLALKQNVWNHRDQKISPPFSK